MQNVDNWPVAKDLDQWPLRSIFLDIGTHPGCMFLVSSQIINLTGVKPLLALHSKWQRLARGCSMPLAICWLQRVLLPSAPHPHPESHVTSVLCSPSPPALSAHISTTHIQPWIFFFITQRLPEVMEQARKGFRRVAQHFMVCHPVL